MLYSFTKQDGLSALHAIRGLKIRQSNDPLCMSLLGQIPLEEASHRFANGHQAYVAYLHEVPAAFGWVATKQARIGELNHTFNLPVGHRYLWNFRTLPEFRGQGIYPHLLQHILHVGQQDTDCFWIMHAPENQASQRGIVKAGFRFMGKVSVREANPVILSGTHTNVQGTPQTLGFVSSDEPQASCWNCSSPYLSKREARCCCTTMQEECNGNLSRFYELA